MGKFFIQKGDRASSAVNCAKLPAQLPRIYAANINDDLNADAVALVQEVVNRRRVISAIRFRGNSIPL